MFSHITLGVNDLDEAARFYDAVLTEIGLVQREEEPDGGPEARCWVRPEAPYPRFYAHLPFDGAPATPGNGTMAAFIAPSREAVDRAHAAGLAHGGTDEGAPGLRPHYAADYYGAYLRDPSGNKIHVVHRDKLLGYLFPG
ncbi:VOC family protein [Celeribacter indicus]|uniref:Glyoxalase/bleomycin resistance protein/dioxygenase superfamily protein 15 n=1 Tax=Celeribacter indicus TaxID=1208324 RepID=A0A0B5DWE9_9RHOB|nr:VOC family protein [Celeribacter indicus]AJE47379.1 glyoxalase/bleomycin resistance protein/dioxygenase superfamily protein 15 [Celeribacter indicus]SDW05027.1 Catechol 2,3-dioxygenase [Celeribacter indicus]